MQKITTAADLKIAIRQLEYKQGTEWPLLKEQFLDTYESLKPINIIKSTFKEVISAPGLKTDVVNAAIGFTTGFVAKKIFIGKANNPLTKLLGIIVEMFVANKVAKNAEGIKSVGSMILEKIVDQHRDSEKV